MSDMWELFSKAFCYLASPLVEIWKKIKDDELALRPNLELTMKGGWIGVQSGNLYDHALISMRNTGSGPAKNIEIHLEGIKILHLASLEIEKSESYKDFPILYETAESKIRVAKLFTERRPSLVLEVSCENIRGRTYSFDDWLILNRFETDDPIYILEKEAK